jgi:[ribosomal protein S5]-alanine N-acetyltransferase
MRTIVTDRLILVPSTEEILMAEIEDQDRLAFLLGAQIPYNWPPEMYDDAIPFFLKLLREKPSRLGWLGWYWLKREPAPERPALIGNGGFKGEPDAQGTVEIGYSVLPQFEGHGYATEGSKGLLDWVLGRAEVKRVIAQASPQNRASERVLEKLGFSLKGDGLEAGVKLWELLK